MQAFVPLLTVLAVGVPIVWACVWLMDSSAPAAPARSAERSDQDSYPLIGAAVVLALGSQEACDPGAGTSCLADPGH